MKTKIDPCFAASERLIKEARNVSFMGYDYGFPCVLHRAAVRGKSPIPGLNIFSIEHQCFSGRISRVIWIGEAVPRRVMKAPSTYAWPWLMREKMPSRSWRKRIGKTGRAHLRKCDTYPPRFRVSVTEWWLMCWVMRSTRRLTRLSGDLISWLQLPDSDLENS